MSHPRARIVYCYANKVDHVLTILLGAKRCSEDHEPIEQTFMLNLITDDRKMPVFKRSQPLLDWLPVRP